MLLMDSYLDNLLFGAIVNSADVNIRVYVPLWYIYVGMELLDHKLCIVKQFPDVVYQFTILLVLHRASVAVLLVKS